MTGFAKVFFWGLLGVSLLANAVTLGIYLRVAGLRDDFTGGEGGYAALPAPIRAEVRQALRDNLAALREPLLALGAARRDMFSAAAARPYDRAAVEATMARVREASAALQVAGQETLLRAFDNAASGGD
jgi:uncharacterized membrane protein